MNKEEDTVVHLAGSLPPSICLVCGKVHTNFMGFELRKEIWYTCNFCSENCFSQTGIPYEKKINLTGKKWHDFWAKLKSYDTYTIINGEVIPIREYLIYDDSIVDVGMFSCFWTPEDKLFYCIVCGVVFSNIMMVEQEERKMYTLDFCSEECANEYMANNPVKFKDYQYFKKHRESNYWYDRWVKIYNAKKDKKDIGKLIVEMDDLKPLVGKSAYEFPNLSFIKTVDESTQDAINEYIKTKEE